MTRKAALVAFNGDPMCFVHVLLNALDMKEKGFDVKLVIEGSACALVSNFDKADAPFAPLYAKVKNAGLIDCVCQGCAAKMGSLEAAKELNLPLCGEMSGHPSLARYITGGYDILTF